jgi:hypothetical protein
MFEHTLLRCDTKQAFWHLLKYGKINQYKYVE